MEGEEDGAKMKGQKGDTQIWMLIIPKNIHTHHRNKVTVQSC